MSLLPATTPATPVRRYSPSLPPEFLIAIQAAVVARTKGHDDELYHQAKVAETVLTTALRVFASDIRQIASRKGKSSAVGRYIGVQLGGRAAAALAVLWSLRSARVAGIQAVFRTSAHKQGFGTTMLRLLGHRGRAALINRIGWVGPIQP